jgi:CRISPR-associated protein Cmr2
VSDRFWLTKILALVEILDFEFLQENIDDNGRKYLNVLASKLEQYSQETADRIQQAKQINDASDRAIFNLLPWQDNSDRITVKHLLSGKELPLRLDPSIVRNLTSDRNSIESQTANEDIDNRKLFWWLWRCLPEAIASKIGAESTLIPASNSLPDASMWSDASLTAAFAGALSGYEADSVGTFHGTSLQSKSSSSRPYLAIFSFTPIQDLIKASRKMRDFWAGSWLLHYLSAKICWYIAQKYGADSLVYPSLYQQPLIDRWLLKKYPDFQDWIHKPSNRSLLTAGFPNVIVAVLPEQEVKAAMQTAEQNLKKEWMQIGKLVFDRLKQWGWMLGLDENDSTWNGWLKSQWQTYWTALPVGKKDLSLINKEIDRADEFKTWVDKQNQVCNLKKEPLFTEKEEEFIQAIKTQIESVNVNVGSWWPYTFDQLRFALSSVKVARTWTVPTAFTTRSTISGIGSIVKVNSNNLKNNSNSTTTEDLQSDRDNWQQLPSLFDGKEQLNATETLKRGLHLVLPDLLDLDEDRIAASYPDLSSGVAGWLRTQSPSVWENYTSICQQIVDKFEWTAKGKKAPANLPWGIPWIDEKEHSQLPRKFNPRLLNAGWAIDDYPTDNSETRNNELENLKSAIGKYFPPGNNPTDWYVLAAGDGDSMSEWLKGSKLDVYKEYLAESLLSNSPQAIALPLQALAEVRKRMGPSSHNALSRALLDFSNCLAPYLTEERYAGRLIYSGGDDVFAYTNLWEWDSWLWDIRQCFRGDEDPKNEFSDRGDYWQVNREQEILSLPNRPLFTMGSKATISFGIVIAHHSVPLAIALENLWTAEEAAKEHSVVVNGEKNPKDAVQVNVLFGNGNILKATSKFDVFQQWRELIDRVQNLTVSDRNSLSALFEQAAQVWEEHPAPENAIEPWTKAFCSRREILNQGNRELNKSEVLGANGYSPLPSSEVENGDDLKTNIQEKLANYLQSLMTWTQEKERDREIQNWLKLAAFVIRNREINLKTENIGRNL